jgi:hypothetical protein
MCGKKGTANIGKKKGSTHVVLEKRGGIVFSDAENRLLFL